jgi:hypothetical protein
MTAVIDDGLTSGNRLLERTTGFEPAIPTSAKFGSVDEDQRKRPKMARLVMCAQFMLARDQEQPRQQ